MDTLIRAAGNEGLLCVEGVRLLTEFRLVLRHMSCVLSPKRTWRRN